MRLSYVSAIAAALCLFAACNNSKSDDNQNPVLEFRAFDAKGVVMPEDVTIENSDSLQNEFTLITHSMLPQRVGDHDITALRDTLMSLCSMTPAKNGHGVFVAPPKGYKALSAQHADSCYNSINYLQTLVTLNNEYAVWETYAWAYLYHAAHGIYSYKYVNYYIPENKILSAADLFNADATENVVEIIKKKLSDPEKGAFPEEVEKISRLPENFYLGSEGMSVVFQPYEVGPYAAGAIKVQLYGDELEEYLSPLGRKLLLGEAMED